MTCKHDGEKIRIAGASDDYILGIVSGRPCVLGNGDCDAWTGMYLRDDFGRIIYEPSAKLETVYVFEDGSESVDDPFVFENINTEIKDENGETAGDGTAGHAGDIVLRRPVRSYVREETDEGGNIIYSGKRAKVSPEYDPSRAYVSRLDRPEWAPVGMLGVLSVIQDGTLEADGYCMCSENGVATKCDIPGCGYRVVRIINDNVAKVVFREVQPASLGKKLQKLLGTAE